MDTALRLTLAILVAFLLGGIPSGLWVGRAVRGIDVRQHGSGNLGATNVYRNLGPRWGLTVLALDAAKGVAAVLCSRLLLPGHPALAGVIGMAGSFVGHMFTPFAGFRGGKGVATAAGAWGALTPYALFTALGVWILIFVTTRIVSLASLIATSILPVALVLFGHGSPREPWIWLSLATAAFVAIRHRGNLGRLRRGEEGTLMLRNPPKSAGSSDSGGSSETAPGPAGSVHGRASSARPGSAPGEVGSAHIDPARPGSAQAGSGVARSGDAATRVPGAAHPGSERGR